MTPDRHARIQEIFEAVVDLSPHAREAYLDKVCGEDAALRDSVNRLLEVTLDDVTVRLNHVMECPRCGGCFDGAIGTCPRDSEPLAYALPGSTRFGGKYQIERSLGRGGMGAVFLVNHTSLDKRFALKVILSHGVIPAAFIRRFEIEARVLGRLHHPNIVDVTDYGVDPREGGIPYLVMEHLEGRTLRDLLKERAPRPLQDALPLLYATAAGIDHAHSLDIIHGDIKPANIFLSERDGRSIAKVLDFGLAQLSPNEPALASGVQQAGHTTTATTLRGTPGYMAPELFRYQPLSRASDLFAFGVLIYEILTGALPFGFRLEDMSTVLLVPPAAPSERARFLPPQVDAPILRLLNPDPALRPKSATAAVQELECALVEASQEEWRVRETPLRAGIAMLCAAFLVLASFALCRISVLRSLEEATSDYRFASIPSTPLDPHLLVVSVDQAALAQDRRPLTDWGPEFAGQVDRMFANGARTVAVDLLLPATWSEIPAFRQLLQRRAGRLVLGIYSASSGETVGAESVGKLSALLLGPDQYAKLFGFVNLEDGPDGVIRRASYVYLDRDRRWRPSLAWAAVQSASLASPEASASPVWIDYSAHASDLSGISWKDVDAAIARETFRDKLVLIGADFPGSGDELRVPASYATGLLPGVKLQALIANTFLSSRPVHTAPGLSWLAPVYLACGAILFAGLRLPHRFPLVIFGAAVLALAYVAIAFGTFAWLRIMIPVVAPEIGICAAVMSSFLIKSRLSGYPASFGKES